MGPQHSFVLSVAVRFFFTSSSNKGDVKRNVSVVVNILNIHGCCTKARTSL